jgi:hypothetical protein
MQEKILTETDLLRKGEKGIRPEDRALIGTDVGKRVIVFTCFQEAAETLQRGLAAILGDKGEVEAVYGGELVGPAVARFKDLTSNSRALVLSILKGGTGLDVPNVVDDVIVNDFSWTPKDAEQSEGRAFRISSRSDVHTRYLVAAASLDDEFFDIVSRKKEIAQLIQNLLVTEDEEIDRRMNEQQTRMSARTKTTRTAESWIHDNCRFAKKPGEKT